MTQCRGYWPLPFAVYSAVKNNQNQYIGRISDQMNNFIGIDLGTTYSAVSTIDEYGKPVVVRNSYGEKLTPSAVYFGPDGDVKIGADAKEMMESGESVAVFFKRFMGKSDYSFYANGKEFTATELSAILLGKLREDAEQTLGYDVSNAVITVPAYFNDLQRNETIKAGKAAGLNVLRIINEPTAAAITYGVSKQGCQRVLVYDLGGGTFDVTIMSINNGTIDVIATGGDHELGGKDFDDMLFQYVLSLFKEDTGEDPSEDAETYNDLMYKCETLKKQLSTMDSATITVMYNGSRGKYTVTRQKFEELTSSLLHTTQAQCARILQEAGMRWSDLDGALLVGGSTRMPMVSNWVRQMTGREPIRGVNVDEAVCLGAAVQAAIEMSNPRYGLPPVKSPFILAGNVKIKDVMSHSLGTVAVSLDGEQYVNSIIIRKNKPIPVEGRRELALRTRPNGNTIQDVYLTQCETTDIHDALVVGHYQFSDITHMPSGKARIEICYSYDENGVINVAGKQLDNNRSLKVEKVPLDDDMSWLYGSAKPKVPPTSVVIAVDYSGSMCGAPIQQAFNAVKTFFGMVDRSAFRLAMLAFADHNKEVCRFDDDPDTISQRIAKPCRVGCCNEANPISACYDILKKEKDRKKTMIILTDGVWDNPKEAIRSADRAKAEGYTIIAIGFGSADWEFLRRISSSDSNAHFISVDEIVSSFSTIAQEISSSGGMVL